MKSPHRFLAFSSSALAALALTVSANAQNYTWTAGANSSWDTTGSWTPSGPPGSTGDIVGSTTSNTAQIDSGTRSVNNISITSQSFNVVGASTSGTSAVLVVNGNITKAGTGSVVFRDSTGPLYMNVLGNVSASGANLRFGSNSTLGITGLTIGGTTTLAGSSGTVLSINMVNGGTAFLNAVNFTAAANLNIRETNVSGTSTVRVTSLSGASGIVQNSSSNGGGASALSTLQIDSNASTTFAGTIRNNGGSDLSTLALVKSGTGSQTLTGANTYSGGTTITAGSLILTGVGAIGTGSLAVGQGGTFDISGLTAGTYTHGAALSGGGTINATGKTFVANGTVNPGDGIGQLNVTGNLTLGSTSATTLTINGTTGGSFDSIAATGALNYGGALSLSFGSLFTSGIVDLNLIDFGSFSNAFSSVTLTGAYAGGLSLVGNLWSGEVGGQMFTFDQATGLLNTAAVPEPGTMALLGLGLAAVLWRSRKRA